jgi:hypothetical protein
MVTPPVAEARRGTATLVGLPSAFLMPLIAATGIAALVCRPSDLATCSAMQSIPEMTEPASTLSGHRMHSNRLG